MQEGGENIMNDEESDYNAKNLNCNVMYPPKWTKYKNVK